MQKRKNNRKKGTAAWEKDAAVSVCTYQEYTNCQNVIKMHKNEQS